MPWWWRWRPTWRPTAAARWARGPMSTRWSPGRGGMAISYAAASPCWASAWMPRWLLLPRTREVPMSNAVNNIFGGGSNANFSAGSGPNYNPLFDPYKKAGKGALGDLQDMLAKGFNPGDLTQTPGFQFQLEQGDRAVQQGAGLQGSPFSGNTMQAL